MNQSFSFQRFWTYFKYDVTQMWRNHSRAALLIGGASAIFYILWVMFSLVFTQEWHSPMVEARVIMFLVAFLVLELYQVKTYGYLTEKKAGSSWLMIPASRGEKFVSMLLVTLVVIPVLFLAVYLIIDGFLSLVDPTYGQALFTGFTGAYSKVLEGIAELNGQIDINLSPLGIVLTTLAGFVCNFLYFLLCGICFKRNKLVGAFAILFGVSTILSLLMGFVTPRFIEYFQDIVMTEELMKSWSQGLLNLSMILSVLMAVGFGWGIWRRIKTIQH